MRLRLSWLAAAVLPVHRGPPSTETGSVLLRPVTTYTKMEGIKATIKVEVKDVLAELDFLHKVDQRRDLYEATAIRRAVHR